ncbi:tyrosine-type recombinase/integrase [Micromonospora foliorum]|uniref:tyrosine-type recombinase/integrase n=1 Tax=Micromonospora foliorum TaxID=2911210 RepID=UPI003556AECC
MSFLTADEFDALLAAPNASRRWEGRRDRALITLAVQTGLRLSELIGLNNRNVQLDAGAHVFPPLCWSGGYQALRALPCEANWPEYDRHPSQANSSSCRSRITDETPGPGA